MLTEDGELIPLSEIYRRLPMMPPTLFAKQAAADFVGTLDAHFEEWQDERWQWRATDNERAIVRPDGLRLACRVSVAIHYFGFKGGSYHKIIDPITMYGHGLDKIWPAHRGDPLTRLIDWAMALRDFCHKNGIEMRPTIGSMSAQFLTDRRFYPKARRKVPMATNESVREHLPGNHYVLTVFPTPHREFSALYLDQRRAHHYHAGHIALPDSNQLYAYGDFVNLADTDVSFTETIPNFYGLYCLDLQAPHIYRRSHWVIVLRKAFVFSNELTHLLDLGYRVNGVYAAWGSHKQDTGLAKYSRWAQKQLDHYGDEPWLKPLLLATYGTLATQPKYAEAVFRQARTGEPVTLQTGHKQLSGKLVRAPHKLEPKIANVLHRGMIEAATRSESVGYAQHLTHLGFRVLSIYADAVIVEDNPDKTLPPMIDPWRLKTTLTHLQFINQQAFVSGEMTKLPGVSQELRDYRQHSPGHAPRKIMFDALTGRPIKTDRRI